MKNYSEQNTYQVWELQAVGIVLIEKINCIQHSLQILDVYIQLARRAGDK